MAVTGFFHHIGTGLLFVSFVLLIVTTITSPVVHDLSIAKINLANQTSQHHSVITYGTFGFCTLDTANSGDVCSPRTVGYFPTDPASVGEGITFSDDARNSTHTLSKVMILHPVATGVVFIAFMLNLGAGVVGGLLSAIVAFIAFLVTAIVTITDFVLFSVIKVDVNDPNSGLGSQAEFGVGIWLLLVAAILTLIATVVVFFTCCSARLHHRRKAAY